MATATRQMRDRVERIMKDGLACADCGETSYLNCITLLFGKQMMVASRKAANTAEIKSMTVSNARGCSSVYGGSAPAA